MRTPPRAPTIEVEADHLVIFPGRDPSHRVIVPRRSIQHMEFSEPHGSRVNHRIVVRTRVDGWVVDLPIADPADDVTNTAAAFERVMNWWTG